VRVFIWHQAPAKSRAEAGAKPTMAIIDFETFAFQIVADQAGPEWPAENADMLDRRNGLEE